MQFSYRRVRTYLTDQSSPADLAVLAAAEGPFDVIIDNGSHINAHQVTTFYSLFEHLRDGGTYVIEDTQTSYWPGSFGGAHAPDPAFTQTCTGEMLELAKYVNHAEFQSNKETDPRRLVYAQGIRRISFEHNMIILEKGNNTLPSNLPVGSVSQDILVTASRKAANATGQISLVPPSNQSA